ncbi:MAG: hypothetical protein WD992_00315, partial [Candidatus Levyibacteriota bacterium]
MKFRELATYLEKLDKTSSRLALIDILSDLFKSSSEAEISMICYLVQGRIAPFFKPVEIGMAEKTVAQSLGISYGSSKEEVLKLYAKLGDMGNAAFELADKKKNKSEEMSVKQVFEILTQIAGTNGEGTVEKRLK